MSLRNIFYEKRELGERVTFEFYELLFEIGKFELEKLGSRTTQLIK